MAWSTSSGLPWPSRTRLSGTVHAGDSVGHMEGRRVREYSTPLDVEVPTSGRLTDDIVVNAAEHPDSVALRRRVGASWEPVTAEEFHFPGGRMTVTDAATEAALLMLLHAVEDRIATE